MNGPKLMKVCDYRLLTPSSMITEACLGRIKELESQLQNVNTKNTEDRAESDRQSVDARAALASRDELQGNSHSYTNSIFKLTSCSQDPSSGESRGFAAQ